MARIDVPFIIEKLKISQPTREKLVAGGKNYFYATFTVSDVWDDVTGLKAEFVREGVEPKLIELSKTESGYECKIPWEVMADKGAFQVGIFGGDRLLTNLEYVIVLKGCIGEGGIPYAPTEDWFRRVDRKVSELDTGKADKVDTYTKREVDHVVEGEINTALGEYLTETEVKDYIDEQTDIIRTDVEGLQNRINEEAHFRGYVSTNAKIEALSATPNDFAYSAESGTKWVYDAESGWQDTGTPVPDQLTPASDSTPLINGVASAGQSNEYARGDHRHPTDTTRVSVEEFNSFKSDLGSALDRIISIQNELIGG